MEIEACQIDLLIPLRQKLKVNPQLVDNRSG
jgi:hypothetical protein